MEKKSEIKFNLVGGEPVCDGECPMWLLRAARGAVPSDCWMATQVANPCIPGLRQQRDELKVKMAEVRMECQFISDESRGARYILSFLDAGKVSP